jgi:hypothetical protein
METSEVRKRLQHATRVARQRAEAHRAQVAATEDTYTDFLRHVAAPLTRQVADVLRAEKVAVTISTPTAGLRLTLDRGRDNYIEFALDSESDPPQVIGRTSLGRGSRTRTDERPVKPGNGPEAVSEDDFLAFLLDALAPWLERA